MNSASMNGILKGIQTGGPIAAYLTILFVMNNIHKRLSKRYDPLASWRRKLTGEWTVTSIAHPSATQATSKCTIEVTDLGELNMTGDFITSDGRKMGTWHTEKIWRDGEKLCYLYILQQPVTDVIWCGHVTLNLKLRSNFITLKPNPQTMSGTWSVYGPTKKSGTIEFSKYSKGWIQFWRRGEEATTVRAAA